jgi:DNA-binding response OmpR family regulator
MKKILIIEDDHLVAQIYRNQLVLENFEAETAPDGESGLELVNSYQPDAVVLDLMLPKLSGLDVLRAIRAKADSKQLPVIVFSNTYLSNMVQEAWKAGATKCMSKANSTPKQLISVIKGLLNQATTPAQDAKPVASKSAVEPSPTVAPVTAATSAEADEDFQAGLRNSFVATLPGVLAGARANLQALAKATDEEGRVNQLQELYKRVHSLSANAGITGMAQIGQMADAVEALLKELYEKPNNITPSSLRTMALAIDFLGLLFGRSSTADASTATSDIKANILVVDDEAISRRAVTYALEKAKLQAVGIESPAAALDTLAEQKFDLVFLDVDMPGMNGFEVCSRLRRLSRNNSTPVVFVTSLTDFESRANSMISGGTDLIAKPFLFMELAVKALVYVLRGRLAVV